MNLRAVAHDLMPLVLGWDEGKQCPRERKDLKDCPRNGMDLGLLGEISLQVCRWPSIGRGEMPNPKPRRTGLG